MPDPQVRVRGAAGGRPRETEAGRLPIISTLAQAHENVSSTTCQVAMALATKLANKVAVEGHSQGHAVSPRSSFSSHCKKGRASETSGQVLQRRVDIRRLR
jgi:hypothetical protein